MIIYDNNINITTTTTNNNATNIYYCYIIFCGALKVPRGERVYVCVCIYIYIYIS